MTLTDVLALGSAAALTASLGPALLRINDRRTLGFSNALAAGMMLGLAYVLMIAGLSEAPIGATIGGAFGVLLMYWAHVGLHIGDGDELAREHGAFVAASVHATAEGVALGAAAAVGHTMAFVVAGTLGLHNITESAVLASRLPARAGSGLRDVAFSVASNLPQVVLGMAIFALASWQPSVLAPLLGASFGAFLYLCFAELLPASYHGAGRTAIAVGVTVAAGIVALVSAGA